MERRSMQAKEHCHGRCRPAARAQARARRTSARPRVPDPDGLRTGPVAVPQRAERPGGPPEADRAAAGPPAPGPPALPPGREGGGPIVVERLSARGPGRVMYRVGGRLPLHSTGVGLVLLAHAPAALQDEILGQDLTLPPENIVRTPRELRAQLAGIRPDGVAVAARTRAPSPTPHADVRGGRTG